MDLTQLEQISQFINEHYNLDTWVNEQTKTIWLSVWNKELTDSYEIEMSKGQIEDFNEELEYQKSKESWKIYQNEINDLPEHSRVR